MLIFVLLSFNVLNSVISTSPTVTISQGVLEGFTDVSTHGNEFYSFLGIPYAKPPVGERRFEPPEPPEPWSGTLYATSAGSECLQFEIFVLRSVRGEENCLFINVYSRKLPSAVFNPMLPVFVFIHGGGFQSGNGSPQLYGAHLFMNREAVLVTLNYRLGVMGFLSTGDSVVPGNMGLKDQVMALKWVQKNIAAFGGDPNRVTIFGQSAGGASVHYHMMSKMSKGLFHSGLSMSGGVLNVWAYMSKQYAQLRKSQLARLLNCPENISRELVSCLKSQEGIDLVWSSHAIEDEGMPLPIVFVPTDEEEGSRNVFLPKAPIDMIKEPLENDVPWVVGMTSNEGLFIALIETATPEIVTSMSVNHWKALSVLLGFKYSVRNPISVAEKVVKYYTGGARFDMHDLLTFSKLVGDRFFKQGVYQSAKLQIKSFGRKSPTYFYELHHHPERQSTVLNAFIANRNITGMGVGHTEDFAFLFTSSIPEPFMKVISTEKDIKVSNHFLDMLITLGLEGELPPPFWKPLTMNFDCTIIKEKLELIENFRQPSLEFWDALNVPYN